MRMGVGDHFSRGRQVDYVLGRMEGEDLAKMEEAVKTANDIIKCYVTQGIDRTMNLYNKKGNAHSESNA